MILEFSVKNFRSIKDLQTISFVATGLKSIDEEQEKNNIVEIGGERILKTVGIYGANASGKSNMLKAFEEFIRAIAFHSLPQTILSSNNYQFYYQDNAEETGIFFQVIILLDGKKYRYGFTVQRDKVIDEWLYGPANENQTYYFIRESSKSNIKINDEYFSEGNSVPDLAYDHILFLTQAASFQNNIARKIYNFFINSEGNTIYPDLEDKRHATLFAIENEKEKDQLINLINSFGFNYSNVSLSNKAHLFLFDKKSVKVLLTKNNGSTITRQLDLDKDESTGTQKLFNIIGQIFRKFLIGGILILDELDGNFHPALVIKLIQLFNDPEVNKANAQLLFTSHDTNLLDPKLLRRDQIYFTEKTEEDATRLYSLADLKGIRNYADFAKQYLAGFYGAVPILENYKAEPTDA